MHEEVLTRQQIDLIPLISGFSKDYYMAGGTAVALHIGHRRSIDFDLFTDSDLKPANIRSRLAKENLKYDVLHEAYDQFHMMVGEVKLTFFNYPYRIPHEIKFEQVITLPGLIDLAAMKALALGGRAKWKDYVDLYFIIKEHFCIDEIGRQANILFGDSFNLKLFRQQLAWHDDIDYTETVTYVREDPGEEKIRCFLTDAATSAI